MNNNPIGKNFGGYTIKKLLGHGGMAQVYQAVHPKTKVRAAIKVIEPHVDPRFDYSVRFEREAKAIEMLKHPNIVGFQKFGRVDNLLFIAMDFIEGSDLNEVLQRYHIKREIMPEAEALRTIKDI